MALRVFVAMPFKTRDGVNFDAVYKDYIKPGLTGAGFDVFRADEEMRAGNIRADMFQELLTADLVVADVSIHNPNVWYELGVRHALRSGGVLLIRCTRDQSPFDTYTDRKLFYHVKDGKPDSDHLAEDKRHLADMARKTVSGHPLRKVSPVYHHLPYLMEPEWKSLLIGGKGELQSCFDAWSRQLRTACRKKRPGDILVLSDEAPVQALYTEALKKAGQALLKLGRYEFALEQVEKVLLRDPEDLETRQAKGILLGRLGRFPEASEWLKAVAEDHPSCAETMGLLGRVKKDTWTKTWRVPGKDTAAMRADAAENIFFLDEAISDYESGFRMDPSHYYSGINALALIHLRNHLTGEEDHRIRNGAMEGGLRWAIRCDLEKETPTEKNFWARATLGDLELLVSDTPTILDAYKQALAVADGDWFTVDSTLQQLLLFRDLGFRPEEVTAAIDLFEKERAKLSMPAPPKQVFLFSGHMIDAPDRSVPRFPAEKEGAARAAIAEVLDRLNAGKDDLALCGGACGGDLLFAELCIDRQVPLEVRLPFEKSEFIEKSVAFAGGNWRDRFLDVIQHPGTALLTLPKELGKTPAGTNPYARNNLWQLYTVISMGAEKLHFISLWDKQKGDGVGGTRHMHDEVRKWAGSSRVHTIDTHLI